MSPTLRLILRVASTWRYLLFIFIVCPHTSMYGQPTSDTARHIIWGPSLPASCRPSTGDVFFKTSATAGPYYCSAPNTWLPIGTGVGGSVTSVGSGCGMSGGPITTSGTLKASELVQIVTGTPYNVLSSDCGKLLYLSNATALAVSIPQAGGTFPNGWYVDIQNPGPGTMTITPTVSTIDGAANLVVGVNQGVRIVSDGVNYETQRGGAGSSAANSRCTFTAASTCSITGLTGVANQAVVSCYDNSGTLTEIIPNDFGGTTADTLVVNFSAPQTGYCNASTGVGATGATGAAGPAGSPAAPVNSVQIDNAGAFGPAAVNSSVGVFWDTGYPSVNFRAVSQLWTLETPTGGLTAALAGAGAGNVPNGDSLYAVVCRTTVGLSDPAKAGVTVVDHTTNGKVTLTLPTCDTGSSQGKRIYRTKIATPTIYYILANVAVGATTYTDNTADSGLGAQSLFDWSLSVPINTSSAIVENSTGIDVAQPTNLGFYIPPESALIMGGTGFTPPPGSGGAMALAPHTPGIIDGAVVGASGVSGNCAKWDSTSGLADSGGPCGGASPGGADLTLQYRINSTTFGGMSGTSWDDTARTFLLVDGSSNPIFGFSADPANIAPFISLAFNPNGIGPASVSSGDGTAVNDITLISYKGGATTDVAGNGGNGGNLNLISGGGANGGVSGGSGGTFQLQSGPGGNASADGVSAGNGGGFTIAASNGGQATGANAFSGNGGNVSISGGVGGNAAASMGTGGNGGNVYLTPGDPGSGTLAPGLNGKVIVNGAFASELGSCTAATLSTILTANTDVCMCTDCQPTSGSDDTCTGSGGIWLAYKTASAVVCR